MALSGRILMKDGSLEDHEKQKAPSQDGVIESISVGNCLVWRSEPEVPDPSGSYISVLDRLMVSLLFDYPWHEFVGFDSHI
jgi:hypothetical protein